MQPASHFRLTLSHFRLIAAIAEHGQLSPAAASLSITQPAASRMLAQIEQIVGLPLFERHPRGMSLTEMGQLLARHADTLMADLGEAMHEVDEFKRGKGGRVRVGAVTGAAVGFVMPAIQRLTEAAPGADVHIEVASSDALVRDLSAGVLDFALARITPPFDRRDFEIAPGRVETVDLVVRKDHPLAAVASVRLAELSGYTWVTQSVGAPMRAAVENAFFEAEARLPESIVNTTSLLAMIALLATSDAIATLSREVSDLLYATGGNSGLAVLPLRESIVISPYHLLSLKNRPLSPLAERLRGLVSQELARPE